MLKFILNLLTRNWSLKIYAVFLTLILFFIAGGSSEKQRKVIMTNISFNGLPAYLHRISPNEKIEVEVYGPSEILSRGEKFLQAEVDLSDQIAGKHMVNVTVKKKLEQIEVIGYNPKQIQVELDEVVTAQRNVELYIPLRLDRNNPKGNWRPSFTEVSIIGPQSRVKSIYQVVAKVPFLLPGERAKVVIQALDMQERVVPDIEIVPPEVEVELAD